MMLYHNTSTNRSWKSSAALVLLLAALITIGVAANATPPNGAHSATTHRKRFTPQQRTSDPSNTASSRSNTLPYSDAVSETDVIGASDAHRVSACDRPLGGSADANDSETATWESIYAVRLAVREMLSKGCQANGCAIGKGRRIVRRSTLPVSVSQVKLFRRTIHQGPSEVDPFARMEDDVTTPPNLDKLALDSNHEVSPDQPVVSVTIECVPKNAEGEFLVELTADERQYFETEYSFDSKRLQQILSSHHSDLILEKTSTGDGTFSAVYAATDKRTNVRLAVKFPRMNQLEGVLREVKMANKILKAVDKSNMATAYELLALPRDMFWIVQNGRRVQLVLTMDLMDMDALDYVTSTNLARDDHFLLTVGNAMMKGLETLHASNIAHMDVKVENLLWSEPKKLPDGTIRPATARLADFGFSLSGDEIAAFSRGFRGTLDYVAPEIAFRRLLSNKTDIYSAGITLFNLATNRFFHECPACRSFKEKHIVQALADLRTCFACVYFVDESGAVRKERRRFGSMLVENPEECNMSLREFLNERIVHGPNVKLSAEKKKQLVDLLWHMLQWHPEKRFTATQALRHPFLAEDPSRSLREKQPRFWDSVGILKARRGAAKTQPAADEQLSVSVKEEEKSVNYRPVPQVPWYGYYGLDFWPRPMGIHL